MSPAQIVDGSDRAAADAGKHAVEFTANPTQRAFILSKAEADLWACRMGEGKSAGLCWAAFHHAQQNPGATHVFVRDTWETLRDTTQKEFFYWFPPGVFGTYKETTKTFTWNVEGMRGSVHFLGMDSPEDAGKVQSRALGGFFMDEPAPAAESGGIDEFVFDMLLTRLRQPGMKWYVAKLAENNPDETHWTYRRFVDPGCDEFAFWRALEPENVKNLPTGYYEKMRRRWAHRQDLVRRFVDGEFGFQQVGSAVTPEWSDLLHLSHGLVPVDGCTLYLGWDFGLNPTCSITQVTPLGTWQFLETHVGEGIGVVELIEAIIAPRLSTVYRGYRWEHVGDRNGLMREQSDSRNSAVGMIRRMLGGKFHPGPNGIEERVEPLRAVLRRISQGQGVVQVDRANAMPTWHALRGGWRRPISRTGIINPDPEKNIHSHPGDVAGYLAAFLYPIARENRARSVPHSGGKLPSYYTRTPKAPLGFERPGARLPRDGGRL